jgi:DNA-nicking Smr family endonuclease
MTKHFTLDPQDKTLFRQAVGPIKLLHCDRINPIHCRSAPIPRLTKADERRALTNMVSDYFKPVDSDIDEELYYRRNGVQQAVLRKLRRSQFQIGAVLDLHGMTAAMAREALTAFLHRARRDWLSCVQIIHGKGNSSRHREPVLKQKINHWLRQRDEVLAFCSARSVDGGTGAIYVLLRSNRCCAQP